MWDGESSSVQWEKGTRDFLAVPQYGLMDDGKAPNDFGMQALASLFMMNNLHYIVKTVESSEVLTVLGEEWIEKHKDKVILPSYHSAMTSRHYMFGRSLHDWSSPAIRLIAASQFDVKFVDLVEGGRIWGAVSARGKNYLF